MTLIPLLYFLNQIIPDKIDFKRLKTSWNKVKSKIVNTIWIDCDIDDALSIIFYITQQ